MTVNGIPQHRWTIHCIHRHLSFYKYFGLMMACIGRNKSPLFKLIKHKIVVFDKVHISFHFNIILKKHNGMSSTQNKKLRKRNRIYLSSVWHVCSTWHNDLYIVVCRSCPFPWVTQLSTLPLTNAHSVMDELLQEFDVKLYKIFFIPVRSIISATAISFLYSKNKQNET